MKKVANYTQVSTDEQTAENQLAVPTDWASRADCEREFDELPISSTDPAGRRRPQHTGHRQAGSRRHSERSTNREEGGATNKRCAQVVKTFKTIGALAVLCVAGAVLFFCGLALVLRHGFTDEKDFFLSDD